MGSTDILQRTERSKQRQQNANTYVEGGKKVYIYVYKKRESERKNKNKKGRKNELKGEIKKKKWGKRKKKQ